MRIRHRISRPTQWSIVLFAAIAAGVTRCRRNRPTPALRD